MKIINRYISLEFIVPFFFSLLVMTFVLLLSKILNIAELIFEKDVGFITIFHIVGSITLYLTGITLPLAFLMGMLMCFGRLGTDNEITALRTSGIRISTIFKPIFIIAIFLFFISFYLHFFILPQANWKTAKSIQNLEKISEHIIDEKVWLEGFGGSSIYIKNLNDKKEFKYIVIHQPVEGQYFPRVIFAKSGNYKMDLVNKNISFVLYDGYIDEPEPNSKNSFMRIVFESYSVSVPITKKIFSELPKKPYHLTYFELEKQINNTDKNQIDYIALLFEKHNRINMAFACIVFLLLGCPLSIKLQRSEKSTNFLIATILSLIWYMIMLMGRGLVLSEKLPVILGTWLPNIIMGTLGLILTLRIIRK